MWYDELPPGKSWAALWTAYILCENCSAIRPHADGCPVCDSPSYTNDDHAIQVDGREITVDGQPDMSVHAVTISMNKRPVKLEGGTASGAEIKAATIAKGAAIRPSFVLLKELSNGTSRLIGDNDVVHLRENLRYTTIAPASCGAEGRYEDWVYLQMLEREWKRPVAESDRLSQSDPTRQPSARAAIVVLFWSYFETRIERLLRAGMRDVPPRLAEDTLQRYSSIGSRLDRLYRVLFETSYWADLIELGFDDISRHLIKVQERRNAFAHGDPRAIDDALVVAVVDNLKREHEAWIAAYNRRGARG
jgi:hypothetical protein